MIVYIRCVNELVNFTWCVPVIFPHPFMVYPSCKYNKHDHLWRQHRWYRADSNLNDTAWKRYISSSGSRHSELQVQYFILHYSCSSYSEIGPVDFIVLVFWRFSRTGNYCRPKLDMFEKKRFTCIQNLIAGIAEMSSDEIIFKFTFV